MKPGDVAVWVGSGGYLRDLGIVVSDTLLERGTEIKYRKFLVPGKHVYEVYEYALQPLGGR